MVRRSNPVGRFAPSPTGRMHLGNLWSALMAWLAIRSEGGQMILRIEDLDPDRSKGPYAQQLIADLKWLGLDWDYGPERTQGTFSYYQSERQDHYRQAFERLVAQDAAYPCFCTREERTAASAPHRGEITGLDADPCLNLSAEARMDKMRRQRHTWRLKVQGEIMTFTDLNFGPVTHLLTMAQDQVVLRRSDGVFAYPLAVVADDGAMGVTQVVRGSDLLMSTPVQLHLMDLLGYERPAYGHVPLLVDEAGYRLSKRQKSMDLGALVQAGWTGEGLLGYLACCGGLIDSFEPVQASELIDRFSWSALGTSDITVKASLLAEALKKMQARR